MKNSTYRKLTRKGRDIKRPRFVRKSIQERFEEYHAKNPHTINRIMAVIRKEREREATQVSMDWVFNQLRRCWKMPICNDFRAPYTRLIYELYPWTVGFITSASLRGER